MKLSLAVSEAGVLYLIVLAVYRLFMGARLYPSPLPAAGMFAALCAVYLLTAAGGIRSFMKQDVQSLIR